MNIDPLALRVARRHSGAVVLRDLPYTSPQLIFSDGGVVTATDVRRVLENHVRLAAVWFCPTCPTTKANVVLWEGIGVKGKTVTGKLVLHAGAAVDHVVAWAEIVLDPDENEPAVRAHHVPEDDQERRLGDVAHRARALVGRLREGKLPLQEVVAALVALVDVAEGTDPAVP